LANLIVESIDLAIGLGKLNCQTIYLAIGLDKLNCQKDVFGKMNC